MGEALNANAGAGGELTVSFMTPPYVDFYWSSIERELDTIPHVWQERWTKEELFAAVVYGRMQLWAVGPKEQYRLVVFTQISGSAAGRVLEVVLAFGRGLPEALPVLDATFEKFALSQGCVRIDVHGRSGFEKALRPLGFRRSCVIMSRELKVTGVH